MLVTDWKYPTATGFAIQGNDVYNQWTNPTNVYADDGSYATRTDDSGNLRQSYGDFGFGVPAGNKVFGIEIETQGKTSSGSVGMTYRCGKSRSGGDFSAVAPTWTTTETVFTSGSSTTLWGDVTLGSHVADGSFYFSIFPPGNSTGITCSLDYVKMRVYHAPLSGFLMWFN